MRALLFFGLCACGSPGPREVRGPDAKPRAAPARIVVGEQARGGSRLVLVDEHGRRVRELTDPPPAAVDMSPAWSRDGRFIVFASSRGRSSPRETSLWILAAGSGAAARLTDDRGIDVTPAFSPDGARLVFGSTRGGGDVDLDLWTLELAPGDDGLPRATGLRPLTDAPEAELMPAFSPDGLALAYASADSARRSSILIMPAAGGESRRLTDGSAPAFSPDGAWLAFSAPASEREDWDLFLIHPDGSDRRRAVDSPLSDETLPRFSRDGGVLFATAVVRGDHRKALLSTLVFLDLADAQPTLRALQEPIPTSRNGVDVGLGTLDQTALRGNPRYTDALRRAMVE